MDFEFWIDLALMIGVLGAVAVAMTGLIDMHTALSTIGM